MKEKKSVIYWEDINTICKLLFTVVSSLIISSCFIIEVSKQGELTLMTSALITIFVHVITLVITIIFFHTELKE